MFGTGGGNIKLSTYGRRVKSFKHEVCLAGEQKCSNIAIANIL